MYSKHGEQTSKNLETLINQTSNFQNERELLKKVTALETEIHQLKEKELMKSTSTSNPVSRASLKPRTTYINAQLLAQINATRNLLQEEEEGKPLKGTTVPKIPYLDYDEDSAFKKNLRASANDEAKALACVIDTIKLVASKINTKTKNTLEEIQNTVGKVEEENNKLMEQIDELQAMIARHQSESASWKKKFREMEVLYQNSLEAEDKSRQKIVEFENSIAERESKKKDLVQQNKMKQLSSDFEEKEREISDLRRQLEREKSENFDMNQKIKELRFKTTSSEDILQTTENQLKNYETKIRQLENEVEKLKVSNEFFKNENKKFEEESKLIKENYELEMEKNIREIDQLKIKLSDKKPNKTGRPSLNEGSNKLINNLANLDNLDNFDFGIGSHANEGHDGTNETEEAVNRLKQELAMKNEKIEQLENSKQENLKASTLLKDIESKNKELAQLREEHVNLKEKMNQTDAGKSKLNEIEIQKLRLEIDQLKDNLERTKNDQLADKEANKKMIEANEYLYALTKTKLQTEMNEKENEIQNVLKANRRLKMTVKHYEELITGYNKRSSV